VNDSEQNANKHLEEMTLLLYVERQLDREAAQEVSLHTQTCTKCLNLLRALDRESRLLTRAMLEQDEPMPARLAEFRVAVKKSMQWIWGLVFGLAVLGVYTLYTGYIEPWELQLEQAGFGSTNLLSLVVFQGAFWKGWQSMFTLFEFFSLAVLAGLGILAVRRYLRRGTALAVMFASLGLMASVATPVSATEFRKGDTITVKRDETIKSDIYLSGQHIRVEGTVDGDVFAFGQQVDVTGHVTGDVICFAQTARVSGQVDGNIRAFTNNITISGNVDKNVLAFNEVINLDSNGKIGHSLTIFTQTATLDGKIGTDFLGFFQQATLSGFIGGNMKAKGQSLTIGSSAEIDGKAVFEGDKPAVVAAEAKLGSPLEYKKLEHKSHTEGGAGFVFWWLIWTSAFVMLGLVLINLLPRFAKECVESAEQYGAAVGLGVLVFFGMLIAAVFACITIVLLLVGVSSIFLWIVALFSSYVVVGSVVGQWILGRTHEVWPLVGRMAIGLIVIRVATQLPFLGFWITCGIWVWGMGAIALALYRRLQPVIAPNIPSVPMAPLVSPLPPNTTVRGV